MASAQWKGDNVQKKTGAGAPRKASHRPKHNHSKIATDLFKEWFYANMQHPFPNDEVKAEFADRTGSFYSNFIYIVMLMPNDSTSLHSFYQILLDCN